MVQAECGMGCRAERKAGYEGGAGGISDGDAEERCGREAGGLHAECTSTWITISPQNGTTAEHGLQFKNDCCGLSTRVSAISKGNSVPDEAQL